MRKQIGVIFATSGIIIILTMFVNIVENVNHKVHMEHDTLVISAFDG